MRGYLSIFTKALVLILLITSILFIFSYLNEKKYEFSYIKKQTFYYKHEINKSIEEELSEAINLSCIFNNSITELYYFPYEVSIDSSVCGKTCFDIEKPFNNKSIGKGKKLITIDCYKREIYD